MLYHQHRRGKKCLDEPDQLAGLLLVVFEDQPTPRKVRLGKAALPADLGSDAAVAAFQKELQYTKHHLQSTIEEMVSSVEELKSINEELQSANQWYAMRIMPYRTLDNYISGAVIAFPDITALKILTSQLQESSRMADVVVETVREPVLDCLLRVLAVRHAFATLFRLNAAQANGKPLADLDGSSWRQPALRQRMEAALRDPTTTFDGYIFNGQFPEAGHRELLVYSRCIGSTGALSSKLLPGIKDVTPAYKRVMYIDNNIY